MMLEFIGRYFMLGDKHAPIEYFVFFLLVSFCACIGGLVGASVGEATGGYSKKGIAVGAILGAAMFCFLIWLIIGDSTSWSKPIGVWMMTRV